MDMLQAPMGTKIVFCEADAGYQSDMDKLAKYLTLGNEYTLFDREIHGSSTDIWIEEVEGVSFNSVSFKVAKSKSS